MKFINFVFILVLILCSTSIMTKKTHLKATLAKGDKGPGQFCKQDNECKPGYRCYGAGFGKKCTKKN